MKTLGINSKLEYTLTGVKATVTAIENDTVLIETEKGEELRSTLAEVNEYLDNGTFKVLEVQRRILSLTGSGGLFMLTADTSA